MTCFDFILRAAAWASWGGGSLSDYLAGKGVPLWQKLATLAVLWISLGVSARLLSRPWVSLLLLAVAIGVTLHVLLFQKTRRAGD